jgi:FkbM family methyltransferase
VNRTLRIALKALRLMRVPRYRHALRHGVGAAIEHEAVLRGLAPMGIGLVLDVGANIGQFTLAARDCLPAASVIAFEPLPAAAARFRRVHGTDSRVELIEAAVAPESGVATLHVSRAADSSSLLPIGAAQVEQFPGTEETHTQTVRRVRRRTKVGGEAPYGNGHQAARP